ncbi:MAG: murein L,D-transpeptidase catalytic domain family protein [Cyclobacteriaceae bacterium]
MNKKPIILLFSLMFILMSGKLHSVKLINETDAFLAKEKEMSDQVASRIWENMVESKHGLKKDVLRLAISGYLKLNQNGSLQSGKPLTIIDFDLPSTDKRMWVIDMKSYALKFNSLVSHGRNSGLLHAENFSNQPESYMSSLGFFLTGETYMGKHGKSLRLDGLENGINDQARSRAIVIHAAAYAEMKFIKNFGRLGRSLGCPALPKENYEEIISAIKDKSCIFVHSNQDDYKRESIFLNGSV